MTILGALGIIFLGAVLLAGARQHSADRPGARPLGLGLDPSGTTATDAANRR